MRTSGTRVARVPSDVYSVVVVHTSRVTHSGDGVVVGDVEPSGLRAGGKVGGCEVSPSGPRCGLLKGPVLVSQDGRVVSGGGKRVGVVGVSNTR